MSVYNTNFIRRFVEHSFEKLIAPATNFGNSSILDLGCGTKPFKDIYQKLFSKTVAGDYDRRINDETIIILDAHNLPFENNAFDCVILTEVLEHLSEPEKCVSEIARVTKDGGNLILTVPFLHQLHEIPYDHFRFTEFQLDKLLTAHGFAIRLFKRRGNLFILQLSFLEFIISLIITALKKTYILWPLSLLLKWIFFGFFSMIYYLIIETQFIHKDQTAIGKNLNGKNIFNIFPMGYCLVAEKC